MQGNLCSIQTPVCLWTLRRNALIYISNLIEIYYLLLIRKTHIRLRRAPICHSHKTSFIMYGIVGKGSIDRNQFGPSKTETRADFRIFHFPYE